MEWALLLLNSVFVSLVYVLSYGNHFEECIFQQGI